MASPPASLPPPPPALLDALASLSAIKRTRKASRLRSLSTRPPGVERPVVHVDPATGKADGPHKKKLRTYLGIVACDKAEFDIPKASDNRTKRKLLQTVGERWRQFKSDLTRKWALAADQDGVEDTKLLAEKTKKKLEVAAQSGSVDGIIDPPSPVRRHVKWKMAHTKKIGEMTTEAAKEIAQKIDVLIAAIGRPEHPGRVRAAGAGVTIKQYFGSAPWTSRNSSSLPPEELQQLTQQIRDQLKESIIEKMQSQGLALPPEPLVGPSGPQVSTKGSCVDPSGNNLETGDSDRCGLYIKADPARLVALGRVYEDPLLFITLLCCLANGAGTSHPPCLADTSGQVFITTVVSPAKPPPKLDPEVDDPLYLMTLTIPELFLRPYQVTWDATVFGVFNPNFPLYIKHEDLSKIAHGGQCLSISVLQLSILHLTETSMRAGNFDIYGFLEPQSIQRSGQLQFESESYIKTWMQSLKRDVYLGAYLNGPDNYLRGIINRFDSSSNDIEASFSTLMSPRSLLPESWVPLEVGLVDLVSEDEGEDLEEDTSYEEDPSMDEEDPVTKPKFMEEDSSQDSSEDSC
ncbi:hypothetical protein GmHk_14G041553 [Glycine max]|nr:hypothetical protein GmHk_14G041553 [Glycine max]